MSQKTYLNAPEGLSSGMLADAGFHDIRSFKNTTGGKLVYGILVALGAADDRCKLITGKSDIILGAVVHSHVDNSSSQVFPAIAVPYGETSGDVQAGYPDKSMVNVVRTGRVWMQVEQAVAPTDKVFVRVTATGSEVVGALRKDADGTDAFEVAGAKFISTTTGAGLVLVQLSGEQIVAQNGVGTIDAVIGAEAAVAANAIEIALTIRDANGAIVPNAEVWIESLAVTDSGGDLAAAGTPVGTLVKADNPATGANTATFTATAGGLVSFRVTNTAAEVTHVRVTANNGASAVYKLTFA